MNQMLLEQLHRYTEDREIDYASAQYLGQSFGVVWKNQQQLVEFKQAIDTYLKTFSAESFAIVESKINVLTGKNTRSTEEAEQLTTYAIEPKTLRKPKQRKVLKSKKKISESYESKVGDIFCPHCGNKSLIDYKKAFDVPASEYDLDNSASYYCKSCKGIFDEEGEKLRKPTYESTEINELRLSGNLSSNISVKNSHSSKDTPNLWKVNGEMLSSKETNKIVTAKLEKAKVDIKNMSLDDKYKTAKKLKLI